MRSPLYTLSAPKTAVERLRGTLLGLALLVNSAIFCTPVIVLGLINSVLNNARIDRCMLWLTDGWLNTNRRLIDHALPPIDWQIELPTDLKADGRYIVTCNHQSWVDTTLMQYIAIHRLPLTRFFTKWELIFIPFLGLCFKVLGFPMMKRHSKAAVQKNPALKQQDLIEAQKSCQKLLDRPFTLLNYLEGTRFTAHKHSQQQSPYVHLLKPKSGGLGLALQILGHRLDGLLDMTVVYPEGIPTYGDFWMGRVRKIAIHMRHIEIPRDFLTADFNNDATARAALQAWTHQLWQEKDQIIQQAQRDFSSSSLSATVI